MIIECVFEKFRAGRVGADSGTGTRLDALFPGRTDRGSKGPGGSDDPARVERSTTSPDSTGAGSTGPGGAAAANRPGGFRGSPAAPGVPAGSDGLSILSAARWFTDRVRSGVRPRHEDPTRRALVPLILGGLAVALAVGVIAWWSRPTAEPVGPPRPVRSTTAVAAPATPAARILVAVTGTVRHPGVVTLPADARVADAITAAGGLLPDADLGLLNLARRLHDGEQVIVGIPGAVSDTSGTSGDGTSPPVNLNTADITELESLPGIGPAMARRIVDWRTEHGGFESVDQLTDVRGIGPASLAELRDRVTI